MIEILNVDIEVKVQGDNQYLKKKTIVCIRFVVHTNSALDWLEKFLMKMVENNLLLQSVCKYVKL